jgi:hypothetical protein
MMTLMLSGPALPPAPSSSVKVKPSVPAALPVCV